MGMLMGREKKPRSVGNEGFLQWEKKAYFDIFDMLTMAHIFLRTGIPKKASKTQEIPSTPISLSILTFC